MKPYLSIIIPVYNVEKYIRKCLNSILRQTSELPEIETIIVDDGSPDKSIEIAENIIDEFPTAAVSIMRQKNQGLSMARNNGLRNAHGEYVWFIDSDDSIPDDVITGIVTHLNNSTPDLLQLNHQLTFEDKRAQVPKLREIEYSKVFSGKEVISNGGLPAPAQFTIYRRDFLLQNRLSFYPGILHEDSEFKPRATYLAEKIAFHYPICYNYLQRQRGSIMGSFGIKNVKDIIIGLNHLNEFKNGVVKETKCKRSFRKLMGLNMNTLLFGFRSLNTADKCEAIEILKKNRYIFSEMRKSWYPKYIIEGSIFGISINLGLKLHSLLR